MRVFVTGGSGFIGSAVVRELVEAGHQVVGLARSDAAAAAVARAGAEVWRGDLAEPEGLARVAAEVDGVAHLGFIHDFSNLAASGRTDLRAIEAMGAALAGSGKPLVIASGAAISTPGRAATEEDVPGADSPASHRMASENAAVALAERGVRSAVIRLSPSVHGRGDHGFVPALIAIAREKGVSAFVGEGVNRWSAVHRLDAARLFRLALESAPGGTRLHGVGEEGVPFRAIAEVIGRRLGVPVRGVEVEEAEGHFGWLARFVAVDVPASNALTRKWVGWEPVGPGLIEDLEEGHYFGS